MRVQIVRRVLGLAVAAACALTSASVTAQTITDGHTIKLNGTIYCLWGIDAPETRQAWHDGWAAEHEATAKLQEVDLRARAIPPITDRIALPLTSRYNSINLDIHVTAGHRFTW